MFSVVPSRDFGVSRQRDYVTLLQRDYVIPGRFPRSLKEVGRLAGFQAMEIANPDEVEMWYQFVRKLTDRIVEDVQAPIKPLLDLDSCSVERSVTLRWSELISSAM